jgi:hypothetical protein
MLRVESESGWWLITHPDHAQLAAAFAGHWGNQTFAAPEPRANVLRGIRVHDDGWAARDARPTITRQGKPSAFSHELVGKYSAFEEIDLADYLAVRESALAKVEAHCAYAALLVSMHTHSLLTEHADRSTIHPDQLPLLDAFLEQQSSKQQSLRASLRSSRQFSENEVEETAILNNFRLLQATDNLSLYSCVGFMQSGNLLHPLPTTDGAAQTIEVFPIAPRHLRLKPYPLDEPLLSFTVPARHVEGKVLATSEELESRFAAAPVQRLTITISA